MCLFMCRYVCSMYVLLTFFCRSVVGGVWNLYVQGIEIQTTIMQQYNRNTFEIRSITPAVASWIQIYLVVCSTVVNERINTLCLQAIFLVVVAWYYILVRLGRSKNQCSSSSIYVCSHIEFCSYFLQKVIIATLSTLLAFFRSLWLQKVQYKAFFS